MVKWRGRHLSWHPPLLTTTPHQREDVSALDRFNVHRCSTREHDFAASKATDHDVVGDETENNSVNFQTLVAENQHINPPEEPELRQMLITML
ncbi:hypothetical protein TNCV_772981 [Trichonephila clavipes]|nr:hypothetical protein TNCV_772981 [Trichonephila clavipes]